MPFDIKTIKTAFGLGAMSEAARDRFEEDIQTSAKRAGFEYTGTTQDGNRLFKRPKDGATVTMPAKENLRRRDKMSLHGFDGYL